jgi:hypothetical protein
MSTDQVMSDSSIGVATPISFQQAIWKNTFKHNVPAPNVLLGDMGPRRKIDRSKTAGPIPFHMERLEYGKCIKMLSMNPSVYGNIYGVLGNS